MGRPSNILTALGAVLLWSLASTVSAGPVILVGDNISYTYDDSQAAIALFGTPAIVGDLVYFIPGDFRVSSLNGDPLDSAFADFVFSSVTANGGGALGGVTARGQGDYALRSGGSIASTVGLTLEDNATRDVLTDAQSLVDTGHLNGAQEWSAQAGIDAAIGFNNPVTDLQIVLSNELIAESFGQSQVAWIQTKLAFLTVGVASPASPPGAEVPAPGVPLLLGLGMVLMTIGKKKKASAISA